MAEVALEGLLALPEGPAYGRLRFEGERLREVKAIERPPGAPERLIVPGFVDLHVHGGGGADVMAGAEGIAASAAFHLRHGTTSLCPTTLTRPLEELSAVVRAAASASAELSATRRGARSLGVHLEGPFLAPNKLGAQPPFERSPNLSELRALLDAGPVAVVTLAPELPGALSLIEELAARGVRASLGHSACTFDQARVAFDAGAGGVTHLFNAMSGLHHRKPGLAAAALGLDRPELVHEVILDLLHVHPAMVSLAARGPGAIALITDAIPATGLADGAHELGGQAVTVSGGRATLSDGTLAGSVLTLDQAFRNALRGPGLATDLALAARWTSTHAARALGRDDLGRLEAGALADVLVFDEGLELERVFLNGLEVDLGA